MAGGDSQRKAEGLNNADRLALKEQGLSASQIEELDRRLPTIRAALSTSTARRSEVIKMIEKALDAATTLEEFLVPENEGGNTEDDAPSQKARYLLRSSILRLSQIVPAVDSADIDKSLPVNVVALRVALEMALDDAREMAKRKTREAADMAIAEVFFALQLLGGENQSEVIEDEQIIFPEAQGSRFQKISEIVFTRATGEDWYGRSQRRPIEAFEKMMMDSARSLGHIEDGADQTTNRKNDA